METKLPRLYYYDLKGEKISRGDCNLQIEKLIHSKDKAKSRYSKVEKEFIRQYSGSGGFGRGSSEGTGVLYEYYTPDWLCDMMWDLARHHGFRSGNVLDPAIGTGNFIGGAPNQSRMSGFEINPVSFRISQILYPKAKLHNQPFETAFLKKPKFEERHPKVTWLRGYPFDLVIGNPPFGVLKGPHFDKFPTPRFYNLESFFPYYGLELLRPGGLLIFIISSQFIRNGNKHNRPKRDIGEIGELLDIYRLPRIFKGSKINVDLLIMRRK